MHGHNFWYRAQHRHVRINGGEEKQVEVLPADGAAQGPNIAQRAPPIGGRSSGSRNRTRHAPDLSICLWEGELLRVAVHEKNIFIFSVNRERRSQQGARESPVSATDRPAGRVNANTHRHRSRLPWEAALEPQEPGSKDLHRSRTRAAVPQTAKTVPLYR